MAINDQPWFISHLAAYRANPAQAHDWDSRPVGGNGIVPTLLLSTSRPKSGGSLDIPLLYQPCGEGFVIVASKGGSNRHPAWYRNLLANPACTAQVGRTRYVLEARTLDGEERQRYWDLMTRAWPAYRDYQARTDRQLPVVILRIREFLGLD